MEEIQSNPEETGLADQLIENQYTEATSGQRFLNYLIDHPFMNYALGYVTGYLYGYLLMSIAPEFLYGAFSGEKGFEYYFLIYMIWFFNYIIYYTFCEAAFKGYTLGKLITGTRAIKQDGNKLSLKDALLRTLSRLVPFEAFSALGGTPWHDTWTGTTVVKSR
ncbi:MAG: RDD family protein [Bacteroidetes bacterium]|nr:RDD family protein [Bacteroidota bacterium]